MVLFGYGDYSYPCRNIPSMPICNLFFRQLLVHPRGMQAPASQLVGLPPASDPSFQTALKSYGVGVDASCFIPRAGFVGGEPGYLGNIANLILCGIAVLVGLALAAAAIRRTAAVGRVEMTILFVMYAAVQGLQLADNSALLKQGSLALTWVTAVHVGMLVALFWVLVWVAFLSLQVVEDGTLLSIIPLFGIGIVLAVGSGYIALDTGLTITNYFQSKNPAQIHSAWLFSLTIVWPAAAAAIYFIIQAGVVARVLREKKPLFTLLAAAFVFALGQAAYYALSHRICTGTHAKIDGSWIATLLETVTIGLIYASWTYITEDEWDDYTIGGGANSATY
ncbi:chitin synthase export chaperone [Rhodotorula toruloides]|uniref:Chitin synthase export chaperone n=1 Tax=Rhodotorula toruloides TaxID=5286 RepID=A0A511KNQ8_RHOTO|nr:chitin synthase export chaperone [Rhodotorula toruloides]